MILTFFPPLIPPPEECFELELSLSLTSPITAPSVDGVGVGVGVGDELGVIGGNGGIDLEIDSLENVLVPDPKPEEEPAKTMTSRIRVEEPETEMLPTVKIEKRRIQPRKPPRVK